MDTRREAPRLQRPSELPLPEKVQLGRGGALLWTCTWVPGRGVIWRGLGHGGCRLPHSPSSHLIRAAHIHSLPNAREVRMKVSWLRFHPGTTGSSMVTQIVDLTPLSFSKAELAFGSVEPKARMAGAPPPPDAPIQPLRKVGVSDPQA